MINELFDIVRDLLEKHSCVIIPNFGGFVANDKPAERRGVDCFMPPSKEIIFNQLLVHNDGLLIQEFMRRFSISFDQANKRVEENVDEILKLLTAQHSLDLSDWGTMSMVSNSIRFVQKCELNNKENSFGLKELYFPILSTEFNSKVSESKTKSFTIRPFLMGTTVAILCLMFFQPLDNHYTEQTTFQPASLMMTILQSEVEGKNQTIDNLKKELDSYKGVSVGYYLIVADFDSEEESIKFLSKIEQDQIESYHYQILSLSHRYYLSVGSATTKEEILQKEILLKNDGLNVDNAYVLSVSKLEDE